MATSIQQATTTSPDGRQIVEPYGEPERGDGWLFFAGSMLGLAGFMRVLDSLWAFGYHGALPAALKDSVLGNDLRTYAWLWLGVGSVLLVSSFFVLVRSQIARWIGMVGAAIGAISAATWLPYYPVWSLTYVALAVLTIYALTRYARREAR